MQRQNFAAAADFYCLCCSLLCWKSAWAVSPHLRDRIKPLLFIVSIIPRVYLCFKKPWLSCNQDLMDFCVFQTSVLSSSHNTWVVLCQVQLPGPAVTQPRSVDALTAVCDVLNPKSKAAVQCSFKNQSSYLLFGIVAELKLRAIEGLPKFGMRA